MKQLLLNYLAERSRLDPSVTYARKFYLVQWYAYEEDNEEEEEEGEKRKEKANQMDEKNSNNQKKEEYLEEAKIENVNENPKMPSNRQFYISQWTILRMIYAL